MGPRGRATAAAAAGLAAVLLAGGFTYGGSAAHRVTAAQVSVLPQASALQQQFVRVVKAVAPSVVQVETDEGLGSGIVFDAKGDIVTNAHVVGTSATFKVTLASGRQYEGALVGVFAADDLAVVRIKAPGLHPAVFADSSKLQVGNLVLAIGNPLGFRSSVTEGIVSGLGRTVTEDTGAAIPSAIQTSAAINPGNSGGALVDLAGRVIGIPTLAAVDTQLGSQASGIGFAIPSNTVKDIASQLIRYGHVVSSHRAYLGVQVGYTTGSSGVYIGEVTSGGPAAKAGIVAGDVITSVNGVTITTPDDLTAALANVKVGQAVKIGLIRTNGSTAKVTVVVGEYPGG